MNLHEYQAKEILKKFGVRIPEHILVEKPENAIKAAEEISMLTGSKFWAVKAQIHAGGRGKGGGVKIAKTLDDVKMHAQNILGMNLVTKQTGPEGKLVNKIIIQQDIYYPGPNPTREFYISILLNRASSRNTIIYSTEGGMEIEEVAEKTPQLIFKEEINPLTGLQPNQCRKIAFNLGLSGESFKEMVVFLNNLYKAYEGIDASMLEINPVLKATDDKIFAVDCKIVLEDNALFRHPEFASLRDITEEDPLEVKARENHLNYIRLDGNVGCKLEEDEFGSLFGKGNEGAEGMAAFLEKRKPNW